MRSATVLLIMFFGFLDGVMNAEVTTSVAAYN